MYNIYQMGVSAETYESRLARLPYGKLTIVLGEDEDGNEVTVRSIAQGNVSRAPESDEEYKNTYGTELVINNPYGTQAMANNVMAQIKGYSYLPFKAKDAFVPIEADLGDVVRFADDQSIIAFQDVYFDGLATSDVGAPGGDETDNEFGIYETRAERERKRSDKELRASFIIELGRIEASLEENYQKKSDMSGYVEKTSLNTSIGQYLDSTAGTAKIVAAASGTYQKKSDMTAYVQTSSLNTSIGQYLDSQTGQAKIISAAAGTYQRKDAMSGYVTTSSLNTSIGQYIDTQAGKAKIVSAVSGTYQTKNDMANYVQTARLNTSIEQYIDTTAGTAKITSAVSATYQTKSGMSDYVKTTNLNNSITQYVNSTTGKNAIVASVSGSFAGKSYESRVEVSESKIGWLIKSGTNSSNFTMTDRAIALTAGSINLSGYVTFNSLSTKGSSSINGDNITTGKIKADLIETSNLKVYNIYVPYPYDFPLIYTDTSSSGVDMYIGSTGSKYNYNLKNIQIRASTSVEIARYKGASSLDDGITFDIANRVLHPSYKYNLWTLGKVDLPFSKIVVNEITFSPNSSTTYNVSLTASNSGSTYTLTPSADKAINLGTTTRRFNEFYVFKAIIGTNDYNSEIGFFGTTPIAKQTLSTSSANMGYTFATASNYLVILNNVVGILSKKYGMFAS